MLLTNKPIYLLIFFAFLAKNVLAQKTSYESESELISAASSYFSAKDFEHAQPLYSQLLSLYPNNAEYNYKYGASLLIVGNDREAALDYIRYGLSKGRLEDEAHFYLGKAYHLNYDFDKAISSYQKFKNSVSNAKQKEFLVDHQIRMCQNGKSLLKKFKGVKVLQKQDMTFENFYRIYTLTGLKGQLLSKPDKFMSKQDKKMNESSVMFFPENATELYFSSYGPKGENGKDIFKVILLGNGKWSDPINLGSAVNTEFDEDFAFMHPENKTLYFASTGHNSMGGYDLFKSVYDPELASWGKAENLDFPYSTVDNDYMFVEVPGNPIAYFASDRFKSNGKTAVYKVNTEEVEPELAVIKGKFQVEGIPEISKATITVKDEQGKLISKVETNRNTEYEIAFHQNGGTYIFNVETTDDSPIHSGKIEMPKNEGMNVYSQELVLKGDKENQTLLIKNNFEPTKAAVSFSPAVLKTQSDLEVNAIEEALAENTQSRNAEQANTQANSQDVQSKSPSESEGSETGAAVASPASAGMQKLQIEEEMQRLEKENAEALAQYSDREEAAYAKADEFRETAETLYGQAEAETDPAISKRQKERADANAAKAAALIGVASALRDGKQILEREQDAIETADLEIAELLLSGNTVQAEKRINILKNSVNRENNSNLMSQHISASREEVESARAELEEVQNKVEKILRDKQKIEEEIKALEDERKNAKSKRVEEINASLKNYSLDVEDHDYRLKLLEKEKQQKQEQLAENIYMQSAWQEISADDIAISSGTYLSAEKQAEAVARVLALKEEKQPFEAIGKDAQLLAIGAVPAGTSAQNSGNSAQSKTTSTSNNADLAGSNSGIASAANAEVPEKDKEEKSSQEADFSRNPEVQTNPTDENNSKGSSQTTAASTVKGNSVGKSQAEIASAKKPSTTASGISGSGSSQQNRGDLPAEEEKTYTLQASRELAEQSAGLKQQAEEKQREYLELLQSVKTLPTETERSAAFERAHQVQEEARQLELQAAIVKGKANQIQFLRNKAELRAMSDSPIPSAKTNMILLVSEEAAIYFDQAQKIRSSIQPNDRYSKSEAAYQDALVYEEKALKKQEQALQMVDAGNEQLAVQEQKEIKREEAAQTAEQLRQEYAATIRNVRELRENAKSEPDAEKRAALIAEADEKEKEAERKLVRANVLYADSRSGSGEANKEEKRKESPVVISVISKPVEVDSAELTNITEAEKEGILGSEGFTELKKAYAEKENLVRMTAEVHESAMAAQELRDSLIQREEELRNSALNASDEEEKVRMVKEAFVINSRIAALNSSLDSASKIIKLRNFLIQRKEESLNQKVAAFGESEKAEKAVLMAQVLYAEDQQKKETQGVLAEERSSSKVIPTNELPSSREPEDVPINKENDPVKPETTEVTDNQEEERIERENAETDRTTERNEEEVGSTAGTEEEQQDAFKEEVLVDGGIAEVEPSEEVELGNTEDEQTEVELTESIPSKGRSNVFELNSGKTSYSNSKPIPIDPAFPAGVVYQVQVGAFRNPIPQDHFKGFAPLMGVTAANGITRYTAGIFAAFPQADQAKDQIRKMGYSDAFVVAFLDGKPISISQARNAEAANRNFAGSVFSTEKAVDIPTTRNAETTPARSSLDTFTDDELASAKPSTSIDGTYYSIQVGVFSKPLGRNAIDYDGFLIMDKLESGLYRYHVGIFDDLETAKQVQKNNLSKDIPDSFVVAYHNGKRISLSQAAAILTNR